MTVQIPYHQRHELMNSLLQPLQLCRPFNIHKSLHQRFDHASLIYVAMMMVSLYVVLFVVNCCFVPT